MPTIQNKKQFTLYIIYLIAIIVVINMVSRSLFFRIDVTDNKMYSLSESSKNVIEKLDVRLSSLEIQDSNYPRSRYYSLFPHEICLGLKSPRVDYLDASIVVNCIMMGMAKMYDIRGCVDDHPVTRKWSEFGFATIQWH